MNQNTIEAKAISTSLYTNDSKVRIIAFFVLVVTILYLIFNQSIFPIFLVIDFSFRAFGLQRYSPLALLSDWCVKTFKRPVKPVFFPKLRKKIPDISVSEIRLLALVKMNMPRKEIAAILGISPNSINVTWHRIRNKLSVKDKVLIMEKLVSEIGKRGRKSKE
jgi:DNA-binding CsgD family transcriptional regulator